MTAKTESELKSLAEFGIDFINEAFLATSDGGYILLLDDIPHKRLEKDKLPWLFFDSDYSPILAHKALEKMKWRLYDWDASYGGDDAEDGDSEDENKFIALWSAIKASGEK